MTQASCRSAPDGGVRRSSTPYSSPHSSLVPRLRSPQGAIRPRILRDIPWSATDGNVRPALLSRPAEGTLFALLSVGHPRRQLVVGLTERRAARVGGASDRSFRALLAARFARAWGGVCHRLRRPRVRVAPIETSCSTRRSTPKPDRAHQRPLGARRRPAARKAGGPGRSGLRLPRLRRGDRRRQAKGLEPLLTVNGAPKYAEGPGRPTSAPAGSWKPERQGATATFARAVAGRYSGDFAGLPQGPLLPGLERAEPEHHLDPAVQGQALGRRPALPARCSTRSTPG